MGLLIKQSMNKTELISCDVTYLLQGTPEEAGEDEMIYYSGVAVHYALQLAANKFPEGNIPQAHNGDILPILPSFSMLTEAYKALVALGIVPPPPEKIAYKAGWLRRVMKLFKDRVNSGDILPPDSSQTSSSAPSPPPEHPLLLLNYLSWLTWWQQILGGVLPLLHLNSLSTNQCLRLLLLVLVLHLHHQPL